MTAAVNADAIAWRSPDLARLDGIAHGLRRGGVAARGGAALLWASWPLLALGALALPPFLLLAVAFAGGSLACVAGACLTGRPVAGLLAPPSGSFAAGLASLVAAQVLWLLALRLLFPAVPMVESPWPVLQAAVAGVTGGAWAATPVHGCVLAAAGALCWAAPGRGAWHRAGSAGIGGLCAAAAPLCLLLHLCLEPRLPLDPLAMLAAAAIGLGPLGIAGLLRPSGASRRGAFSGGPRPAAAGR